MDCRGTRSPIVTQNGDRLVITVPLRRGVDLVSFVSEVVNALTGVFGRGTDGVKGGSTTVKVVTPHVRQQVPSYVSTNCS